MWLRADGILLLKWLTFRVLYADGGSQTDFVDEGVNAGDDCLVLFIIWIELGIREG